MPKTPITEIIGKRITAVRPLDAEELAAFMWDRSIPAFAISLDDGTEIIAAADQELNRPGAFVVITESAADVIHTCE
jgi:hypothetical protein